MSSIWEAVKKFAAAVGALAILVSAIFGLTEYIDSRVQRQLSNPETLRSIAAQLRPAIVFDSHGTILADRGGMTYIADIKVVPGNGLLPKQVILVPKAFLAAAPLLESLNEPGLNIQAERGKGIEWRFNIKKEGIFDAGVRNPHFRLELLSF